MNDTRSCCEADSNEGVSRDDVRNYYSKAAVTAQESLCCPTKYRPEDLAHIPKEVLEISYGCGSPVGSAVIKPGEIMVDLGSGGGIDCFIAARHTGKEGRVIGIDMTEDMLAVARKNAVQVGKNLGYNNIEFKQGFLEALPLDDHTADLVTSNCVINLSTQKTEVFREICRILKPGGRFVIADIISDKEVPEDMRNNTELWGECVSGALTLREFLALARQSAFHGMTARKDYLWKEIGGIKFYSYILEGHKAASQNEESCRGPLTATYIGPCCSVTCDGVEFPIGQPVEVDSGFAERLAAHPYSEYFAVTNPAAETPVEGDSCCG